MKTHLFALMLLSILTIGEKSSHAFIWECDYVRDCRTDATGRLYWATSTTLFGPLAVIFDGSIDLSNPATHDMLVTQSEQVLNGQGDAINQSENLVHALAKANSVSDENLAQAVKSLDASGSGITEEAIRQALK